MKATSKDLAGWVAMPVWALVWLLTAGRFGRWPWVRRRRRRPSCGYPGPAVAPPPTPEQVPHVRSALDRATQPGAVLPVSWSGTKYRVVAEPPAGAVFLGQVWPNPAAVATRCAVTGCPWGAEPGSTRCHFHESEAP